MMDYQKIASDVYNLADSDEPIAPLVREALQVIEQCLDQYGWAAIYLCSCAIHHPDILLYRQDHISLSFNGGKDCA